MHSIFYTVTLHILVNADHAIQSQRDDQEVGRPITRKIRSLPEWATFQAVGVRGERERERKLISSSLNKIGNLN